MADKAKRDEREIPKRGKAQEELMRLRERIAETKGIPDIASEALRKARSRTEEFRTAFGTATDELARTRALLLEAWKALKELEFSAPAYNIASEKLADASPPPNAKASGKKTPDAIPEGMVRGACPACGGLESHSPACALARALNLLRDPRPRRYELEDAVDRAWFTRTGESDGVRARLVFLDVLFAELAKWGAIRED